jgi:hypothetical protein
VIIYGGKAVIRRYRKSLLKSEFEVDELCKEKDGGGYQNVYKGSDREAAIKAYTEIEEG